MSVRLHCELCAQHFSPQQEMATFILPGEASQRHRQSPLSIMSGTRHAEADEHHLCLPCARALWSLVRQHRADGASLAGAPGTPSTNRFLR